MLQTLPSRRTDSARPASPATGAYKVDISRGERIGRVSSEWFSRPDDERYLSLGALHAAVRTRAERATARTVETKAVRVEATLGMASFYLRAVCMNRNIWGAEGFEEISIRHSKFAGHRFAHQAAPALERLGTFVPSRRGLVAALTLS